MRCHLYFKKSILFICVFAQVLQNNAQTEVFNKAMRLANEGNALSQLLIGEYYYLGIEGVSVDYEKAYNWIHLALNNKNTLEEKYFGEGCNFMGIMNLNGLFVPKDIEKAKVYFKKAVNKKNMYGWYNLGIIGENKQDQETSIEQAFDYYKKAADGGLPIAMFKVARFYEDGIVGEKDIDNAIKWYRKASDGGDVSAMVNLGALFYNAQGEDKDVKEAYRLWKKADSLGNKTAHNNLEKLYNRKKPKEEPPHIKKKGKNGFYGLYTKDGKELLPCEYGSIFWFNGVYKTYRAFFEGIATAEGIELIKPDKYTYIEHAGKGYQVHIGGFNGFMGCCDNSGKEIIAPNKFRWACHFNKNRNVVKIGGKTGVYDDSGKELFMTHYNSIIPYVKGDGSLIYYITICNGDTGRIDSLGKEIIPIKVKKRKEKFTSYGKDYYKIYDINGRLGLEDANNKVILPSDYDNISIVLGRIKATQNEYTGVFTLDGKPIISLGKYHDVTIVDSTNHISTKYYRVFYKDKVGACDENGKEIIAPIYNYVTAWTSKDIVDGDFKVTKGDYHGIIKRNGKVVLPIKYTSYSLQTRKNKKLSSFFYVRAYDKMGICDSLGNEIISLKYDDITSINSYDLPNVYFKVEIDDKEGVVKDDGTVIISPDKYDNVKIDKYNYGNRSGQLYILAENEDEKDDYSVAGVYLGKNQYKNYLEKRKEEESARDLFFSYFNEGYKKFEEQKYSAAIKNYKKALKYLEDGGAYFNLGAAYYNQNSYKKAIESFENCIRVSKSDNTINKAKELIKKSHDYWEQKKERRNQIAMSIVGGLAMVGAAAFIASTSNNISTYNNSVHGFKGRDTSNDYLLDPRLAMRQAQEQELNEYREFKRITGAEISLEEYRMLKAKAAYESENYSENSDDNNHNNGYYSPESYQARYNKWEKIVQDHFKGITYKGSQYQDNSGNVRGTADSSKMNIYVGMQSNIRDAQNQMKNIRREAEQHGITIVQSKWETATASF